MEDQKGRKFVKRLKGLLLADTMYRQVLFTIISLVVFIAIWQIASVVLHSDYLPGPGKVWDALVTSFSGPDPIFGTTMWENIWASVQRFGLGFIIAFAIGVPAGLLMGFSRTTEILLKPIVEIFRPIPPIVWVPIFFVLFSYIWGPVLAITIGAVFPIITSVSFGVKSVDPIYYDAAKTQGASRLQIFNKIVVPFTLPYMMTGVRIGLGVAWMCIVAAEMIMAIGGGLGLYIWYYAFNAPIENAYAGIIVLAVLGLSTVSLAEYIENYILKTRGE
ncbi:MAG: taurine transporter subunit [Methanomassiliicoccales archaeon PtaU1.Bin124]|nr:MAG: taurine transporter subunit [Methanomassiliicoccales archaeon PtaU1.Bin124]